MRVFRYLPILLVFCCGIAQASYLGTDLSTLTKSRKPPVTKKEKQQGTFKGSSLAAGAVVNTGNTSSSNISANGTLQYTYKNWIHALSVSYLREENRDDGLTANRVFVQGQSRYNLDKKQFVYTQVNYIRDKFDGYNYIFNWAAGYGRYVSMPKNMSLDWLAGPGINQYQDINNVQRTSPSIQAAIDYAWNIQPDLIFSETLETVVTNYDVRTISTTGLTTKLNDKFSLDLLFQAINDNHPPAGKTGFNTITTLQIAYNI